MANAGLVIFVLAFVILIICYSNSSKTEGVVNPGGGGRGGGGRGGGGGGRVGGGGGRVGGGRVGGGRVGGGGWGGGGHRGRRRHHGGHHRGSRGSGGGGYPYYYNYWPYNYNYNYWPSLYYTDVETGGDCIVKCTSGYDGCISGGGSKGKCGELLNDCLGDECDYPL
uniref:Uncharacterized protein n=1 Tax=Marseillevirus LCMAC101 TaxID=2506602 RepID=A0A481YRT6_9VIRU|nr:MAG: uncharacterized protein LCMAC101_03440 [Marseillevirus LCMAC101]